MVALVLVLLLGGANPSQSVREEDYGLIDSPGSHLDPGFSLGAAASHRSYIRQPDVPLLTGPGGDTLAILGQGAPVFGSAPVAGFRHVLAYGLFAPSKLACEGASEGERRAVDLARSGSDTRIFVNGTARGPTIQSRIASCSSQCTTRGATTLFHPDGFAFWSGDLFRSDIGTVRGGTVVHVKPGIHSHMVIGMVEGWIPAAVATTRLDSISFPQTNPVLGQRLRFRDQGDSMSVRVRSTAPSQGPAPEGQELELLGPDGEELWRGEVSFLPVAAQPSGSHQGHFIATIPTPPGIIASCRIRPRGNGHWKRD